MGQGLNCIGRVRAARHSCDRHTPAAWLGHGPGARAEKQLPLKGEHEGPG